ncbi:PPOX class F420-dependent oxidoreductase [Actinomadura craniellae]|uniref:PPOX class F420-dependent oxidoreductase n=1 Tax=Actinomadura craniellae TaxID=2231787 RepID=A0A365H1E6_9ACTN|nr:PPOX class F420-dependent oxidoreductase [Actinomadura craniellae]RAY12901.1 PPOX class F420-dependent oxidoreductase [Actinomadura craniellae]
MVFTAAERDYLGIHRRGHLATIGPGGAPQVKPIAYILTGDAIDIGGPNLTDSRKYRNIQADPRVSFALDDEAEEPVGPGGQTGRGLEIRGTAELLVLEDELLPGFSRDVIRVHPRRIIAWNIDGPGPNIRNADGTGSATAG